jgi:hypothetical protein
MGLGVPPVFRQSATGVIWGGMADLGVLLICYLNFSKR